MLVSGREAIRILKPVVSGDKQAQRVLRSGLAGAAIATPAGPMYDEQLVRALVGRPFVDVSRLVTVCPHGLYISRIARTVEVDASAPWPDLVDALALVPAIPTLSMALLEVQMTAWDGLPWVATLCGWVVLGGEAQGIRGQGTTRQRITRQGIQGDEAPGRRSFDLRPPGDWFGAFEGRRLPTSRGGRPWYLWTPV